jgi:hypothetical protein
MITQIHCSKVPTTTDITEKNLTENKFNPNGVDVSDYFYKKNSNLDLSIFNDKLTIDYSAKSIEIENKKTTSTNESVKSVEYTRKYTMTEQGLEIKYEITKVKNSSVDIKFSDFTCTKIEIKTELIKIEELKKTNIIALNLTINATAVFLLAIKDNIYKFTAAGIGFLVTPADLVALNENVKGANLIIDGTAGFNTALEGSEEEIAKKYTALNNAIDNNKITVITNTEPCLTDGKTLTKVDKFDSKTGICIKIITTATPATVKYVTAISQICEITKIDPKKIGWSLLKYFMVYGGIPIVICLVILLILYVMKKGPFAPKDLNEEATKDAVTTNVPVPAKEVAKAVTTDAKTAVTPIAATTEISAAA